jgi:hypothetical protein
MYKVEMSSRRKTAKKTEASRPFPMKANYVDSSEMIPGAEYYLERNKVTQKELHADKHAVLRIVGTFLGVVGPLTGRRWYYLFTNVRPLQQSHLRYIPYNEGRIQDYTWYDDKAPGQPVRNKAGDIVAKKDYGHQFMNAMKPAEFAKREFLFDTAWWSPIRSKQLAMEHYMVEKALAKRTGYNPYMRGFLMQDMFGVTNVGNYRYVDTESESEEKSAAAGGGGRNTRKSSNK